MPGTDAEKYANLRAQLERALRPHGLPDSVWKWLQQYGLVQDAISGRRSVADVAAVASQYIEESVTTARELGYAKEGGRLDTVDFGPDRRLEVLSEVAALEAPSLAWVGVNAFRRDYFGGCFLEKSEVQQWLQETAKAEGQPGPADEYITIPLPRELQEELHLMLMRELRRPRDKAAYSEWLRALADSLGAIEEGPAPWVSGPLHVLGVPARRDGVLALLHRIAEDCAHYFSWTVDQALYFVLCGTQPPLSKVKVTRRTYAAFPALDRLAIVVDPRATPRELASIYERARRELALPGGSDKPMTEKNLQLALFAHRHRQAILSGQTSWPDLRSKWNEEHPDMAATKSDPCARQFGTECRTAWKRLTGAEWQRPSSAPPVKGTSSHTSKQGPHEDRH